MYLKEIEITGFWGSRTAKTELFSDVNVFIGRNGSGKTTLMNLLQACLEVDYKALTHYEFERIRIILTVAGKKRTVAVTKSSDPEQPYEDLIYSIGTNKFQLRVFYSDLNASRVVGSRHFRFRESIGAIKEQLSTIVQVASLSVHRMPQESGDAEEYMRIGDAPRYRTKSQIDLRLNLLMKRLTGFQLNLYRQVRVLASHFEKDVLVTMLYDPRFDHLDSTETLTLNLEKEEQELTRAYKELNAYDSAVKRKIENHFRALQTSIEGIRKWEGTDEPIDIDHLTTIALIGRTQRIVGLTREVEEKKSEIFRPINTYLETVKDFISDKSFSFRESGELEISLDGKTIEIENLSSGEKQLLILLTETILQKGEPFVFLADEPEISLHIEWQEKVISSIRKLNENAQVIVATHSPEIAGHWNDQIIDMEDVLNG